MGNIRLEEICNNETDIEYYFSISEDLQSYFNEEYKNDEGKYFFFIKHEDKQEKNIPINVAVIPFIGIMFGIAICTQSAIEVPEINSATLSSFYKMVNVLKELYKTEFFCLNIDVEESVISGGTVVGNQEERNALFFTGGLDATSALYQLLDSKPVLINIEGADIGLSDLEAHSELNRYFYELKSRLGLNYKFIKSNCRALINESRMDQKYLEILDSKNWHGYWASIAHTIVTATVSSPFLFANGITKAYFGSTYPLSGTVFDANHVKLIYAFNFSNCIFQQIDEDTKRIDKILTIRKFVDRAGFFPQIHAC